MPVSSGPRYVIDPILLRAGGRLQPRQLFAGDPLRINDADEIGYVEALHDTLNAILRTGQGALKLTTDEGTNTDMVVTVVGKGTGVGRLQIADEDKAEAVEIFATGGAGHVRTIGASPGALNLQGPGHSGVDLFSGAGSGSNRYLTIYGWDAANAAVRYGRLRIASADGAFEFEAESGRDLVLIAGGSEQIRVKSDKADFQKRVDTPMTVLKTQSLPGTVVLGGSVFDGTSFWDGVSS